MLRTPDYERRDPAPAEKAAGAGGPRPYRVHRTRRRPRPVVALAVLTLAVVAAGVGALSVRGSTPADPPAGRAADPSARHAAALRPPPLAVPHPPVSISQPQIAAAASNAALELAGSGDGSPIAWFPNWGLWGNHNAPPGARVNWGSPYWWQSALDLLAMVRYLEVTHDANPIYQRIIEQTFAQNIYRPGTPVPVNFGNKFMDDTGWWGLAWLEAARYELAVRGNPTLAARYLKVAEWDASYLWKAPHMCHQPGIEWQLGYPPDTITNAEFVALAGELGYLLGQPGPLQDTAAADTWTTRGWQIMWWLRNTRLANARTGHVWDGLGPGCTDIGGALVYTEGEVADGLVQLGLATGKRSDFAEAQRFIQFAFTPAARMLSGGVLQQPCEAQPGRCLNSTWLADSTVYKGLFVDAVADWQAATHSHLYDAWLRRQAQAVVDTAASDGSRLTACQTPHDCQLGFYWARAVAPADGPAVTPGTQMSGLSALTDALGASSG